MSIPFNQIILFTLAFAEESSGDESRTGLGADGVNFT